MTGELTTFCDRYYELTQLLAKREECFKNLLDDAPLYCGQTSISEVDDIISYYRRVQAFKAKFDKTIDDIKKTGRLILEIMKHFEMPPGTVLTGEIPGELAYELWANENDALYINKTKNLQPVDNPNFIFIKVRYERKDTDDDDL